MDKELLVSNKLTLLLLHCLSVGEVNDDVLRIGNTTAQLKSHHNLEVLVPDVLFYENQQVTN